MKELKFNDLLSILFKEKNVVIFVEKDSILRWYVNKFIPIEDVFVYLSYDNCSLFIQWDDSICINDFKKVYIIK